ncbi:MAG TPA: hypothetical protein VMF65_11700 [Acidimicrobiales bacterium]|nr:hypothetical protein [Acidimicrobiales bacterium]
MSFPPPVDPPRTTVLKWPPGPLVEYDRCNWDASMLFFVALSG